MGQDLSRQRAVKGNAGGTNRGLEFAVAKTSVCIFGPCRRVSEKAKRSSERKAKMLEGNEAKEFFKTHGIESRRQEAGNRGNRIQPQHRLEN